MIVQCTAGFVSFLLLDKHLSYPAQGLIPRAWWALKILVVCKKVHSGVAFTLLPYDWFWSSCLRHWVVNIVGSTSNWYIYRPRRSLRSLLRWNHSVVFCRRCSAGRTILYSGVPGIQQSVIDKDNLISYPAPHISYRLPQPLRKTTTPQILLFSDRRFWLWRL